MPGGDASFYITADIRGLEFLLSGEFQVNLLDAAIGHTANEMVIDMQDAIYEPKRGAVSNKSGPFRVNTPGGKGYSRFLGANGPGGNNNPVSVPGEAPANQTETLAQSIFSTRIALFTWQVVVGAYYGYYLEYGTRKMAPRPFLGPALMWAKGRLEKNVKEAFMKIVVVPQNTKAGGIGNIAGITAAVENPLEKSITDWARAGEDINIIETERNYNYAPRQSPDSPWSNRNKLQGRD